MPVVTDMEVHQRDKERVRLFLDDEYVLDLPLMEAARLSRGQTLTDSEVDQVADARRLQRAYDLALRYLSYRPRSTEEVRRHLAKKQLPDSRIAEVLERLRQRGYVDDMEFARYWISSRDRFKPMGLRALKYELRQKGVDDEIVDASLAEVDEEASAIRAAQTRMSRYRGSSPQAFRHKLSAMLRRRGFGEYTIRDIVLRLQLELEERDPGYFQDDAD
ncbi:MAG: RecX family transcriptional regulator [Chloroflexi bacterium]|nr:RecX family transcriptional regulator [Chloroflexota bacterium]